MESREFNSSLCLISTVALQHIRVIFLLYLNPFLIFNDCNGVNNRVISFACSRRTVKDSVQTNIGYVFFLQRNLCNIHVHKCLFQFITQFPRITFVSVFGDITTNKRNHPYLISFSSIIFSINTIGTVVLLFHLFAETGYQPVIVSISISVYFS